MPVHCVVISMRACRCAMCVKNVLEVITSEAFGGWAGRELCESKSPEGLFAQSAVERVKARIHGESNAFRKN